MQLYTAVNRDDGGASVRLERFARASPRVGATRPVSAARFAAFFLNLFSLVHPVRH